MKAEGSAQTYAKKRDTAEIQRYLFFSVITFLA